MRVPHLRAALGERKASCHTIAAAAGPLMRWVAPERCMRSLYRPMPTKHGLGCEIWRLNGQSLTIETEVLMVTGFDRRGILSNGRCQLLLRRHKSFED